MKDHHYWIDKLQLETHPEGGYYKEVYESSELIPNTCLPSRYKGNRAFSTSIYFLITSDKFSALHRLQSDEVWHFYYGSPLLLHIITPGGRYIPVKLGSDPDQEEVFQHVVSKGYWMAATVMNDNSYSLVGNTVSPGFKYEDFEMAKGEVLSKQFSHLEDIILKLSK